MLKMTFASLSAKLHLRQQVISRLLASFVNLDGMHVRIRHLHSLEPVLTQLLQPGSTHAQPLLARRLPVPVRRPPQRARERPCNHRTAGVECSSADR